MPRNNEIQRSPDSQKSPRQVKPFQLFRDKIEARKERKSRERDQRGEREIDNELGNVLPSKRNTSQKREAPASLNTESSAPAQRPTQRGIQRQLDTDLDSVFPPTRKNTSGRRKFGSLLGSRNSPSEGRGARSFNTKTTGYWPAPKSQANAKGKGVAAMEGGDKDREGNLIWPNHTIDFVERKAQSGRLGPDDYVAVAMDSGAYPYGTNLTSPAYPGIPFRVVDTGSAFRGKGTAKVDIATSNYDRMNQLTANNVRFERV